MPENTIPTETYPYKLAPCPFCGAANVERRKKCVVCIECGATGPYTSEDVDDDTCERDWNTRAPVAATWQPIETAPKDGTQILMGKWHDGTLYWVGSGAIEGDEFWLDFIDDFFKPEFHQQPTHWMPLPALPSNEEPSK